MPTTHNLTLTGNELLFLDDQINLLMMWADDLEFNPGNFLRKLGHGIEATTAPNTSSEVEVTLGEAWMIHESSPHYVTVGQEKVGLSLKRKSYEAIFALEAVDGEVELASMPDYMNEFMNEPSEDDLV